MLISKRGQGCWYPMGQGGICVEFQWLVWVSLGPPLPKYDWEWTRAATLAGKHSDPLGMRIEAPDLISCWDLLRLELGVRGLEKIMEIYDEDQLWPWDQLKWQGPHPLLFSSKLLYRKNSSEKTVLHSKTEGDSRDVRMDYTSHRCHSGCLSSQGLLPSLQEDTKLMAHYL